MSTSALGSLLLLCLSTQMRSLPPRIVVAAHNLGTPNDPLKSPTHSGYLTPTSSPSQAQAQSTYSQESEIMKEPGREALHTLPLGQYQPRSRLEVSRTNLHQPKFPAFDAHTHLGRWLTENRWAVEDVPSFVHLLDEHKILGAINLDGRWGEELHHNLVRYDRAFPDRFFTFCQLDWTLLQEPLPDRRLVESLEMSIQAGARGLKVWKDLGLHVRDHRGERVGLADERLHPVWETAGQMALPIFIHTADPVAFWDPVDAYNERLEELLEHPEWSVNGPQYPSFRHLMQQFETVVATHPKTTFVGVHVGCYAENLSWVDRMLTTYPNYYIDIGARIAELGRQPRAARELLLTHYKRVLFGTDEIPPNPQTYAIYFRFLETNDEYFDYAPTRTPPTGRWCIYALDLPDSALHHIYSMNTLRLLKRL
jgi:predicted TIM-barrel fold metal-dependent hydrolase